LEAWIRVSSMPDFPALVQGRLLVKDANIGRRALTIEKIYVQVFEDELEELRKAPVAEVGRVERIGFVARFTTFTRPSRFPVQLGENEPINVEMIIGRVDDLSRNRFCLVYVTGSTKPIKLQCAIHPRRPHRRYFSGS
jgi:hypothetical protein